MSGNRSLDEFAGAGGEDGADEGGADGQGAGEAEAVEESDADVATPAEEPADSAESGEDDGVSGDDGGAEAAVDRASIDDRDARADTDAATDIDDPADDSGAVWTDRAELDPPASTYVWSPDGGPCATCGSTVEERWRDGDDLVCAGCKEW